jgi:hypothetical protein
LYACVLDGGGAELGGGVVLPPGLVEPGAPGMFAPGLVVPPPPVVPPEPEGAEAELRHPAALSANANSAVLNA